MIIQFRLLRRSPFVSITARTVVFGSNFGSNGPYLFSVSTSLLSWGSLVRIQPGSPLFRQTAFSFRQKRNETRSRRCHQGRPSCEGRRSSSAALSGRSLGAGLCGGLRLDRPDDQFCVGRARDEIELDAVAFAVVVGLC